MEAIALIMSKFSEELIGAQLALLFFTASIGTYWLLIRKKRRESAEWVPAALVRAYLDRVQADEREIRMKLFGEASPAPYAGHAPLATALASAPASAAVADPNLQRELEALRSQLSMADQRAMEFDRMMNAIRAEKTALEQKLKDAQAASATGTPAAPAAGGDPAATAAVQKELDDLRAKLQEYEVIEDDLANLKKFQKENEQLRQKVEQYEKGGGAPASPVNVSAVSESASAAIAPAPVATAAATAVAGSAAEADSNKVVGGSTPAAPAMTVIPGGGAQQPAQETMIISGGSAPAASAPAQAAPAPAAPAPAPAAQGSEVNTNVLQEVTPTLDAAPAPVPAAPVAAAPAPAPEAKAEAQPAESAAAPAPEKSAEQKEEELLSEFEKMLAS